MSGLTEKVIVIAATLLPPGVRASMIEWIASPSMIEWIASIWPDQDHHHDHQYGFTDVVYCVNSEPSIVLTLLVGRKSIVFKTNGKREKKQVGGSESELSAVEL